jgi:hypothetical protein
MTDMATKTRGLKIEFKGVVERLVLKIRIKGKKKCPER